MPRRFICKKNKYMAVLTIAVSAIVALPVLLLPVGVRQGTPADFLVGRAYAQAFPYNPNEEEILVEQWALSSASDQASVDGLEDAPEGEELPLDPQGTNQEETDATTSSDPSTSTGLIKIGEGQTVSATYINGATPAPKEAVLDDDFLTATILQHTDEDGRPIEILDPSTFISDETTVYINTMDTIIKEEPRMDAVTVSTINRGEEVLRIGLGDSWAKIRTESGIEGYIPQDNLTENMLFIDIDRTVWVDADELKLRSEPSTASEILRTLSMDTPLHCSAVSAKWYRVVTTDGTEGYVYISYTTESPPPTPVPTPVPQRDKSGGSSGGSSGGGGGSGGGSAPLPDITGVNGESIVNICISMLGVQYEWAGESRNGVDCSGLIVYAYRQIGIELPHQSNDQKSCGIGVDRSEIALGDIICWDIRGSADSVEHVGIYVGNGQVIHASSTRDQVEYGSLDMYPIVTIRRIIA